MEWNKTFSSTSTGIRWGEANSVQQTSDGGYIVSGWSANASSSNAMKAWLTKTDSAGNQIWDRTFDTNNTFYGAESVQQTSDGGYIIAGSAVSSYLGGLGLSHVWFIKTDANGNV